MKIDYSKTTDKRRIGRVLVRMTDAEIKRMRAKEARKKEEAARRKRLGIVTPPPINRTPDEAKKRRGFAKSHKCWTNNDWERVVWTQMTRVQNVRFFATMTSKGVGKLAHVNVEVKQSDKEKRIKEKQTIYMDTIKDTVLSTVKEHGLDPARSTLQVDYTYANYANVKEWLFKDEEQPFGNILVWPMNSVDIDPVLPVLEILKKKLYDNYEELPKNGTGEMWERIQETWASITPEEVQAEILKTHQRLVVLLERNGMKVGKIK